MPLMILTPLMLLTPLVLLMPLVLPRLLNTHKGS